jgi:two-component system nitrate/nitrite sensor histidine kinase NarX
LIQAFGKRTLRTKIIVWSFVPTAIILIAVALINFQAYQRVTEDLVIERDRELTRLWANQLASRLAVYTDPLTAWARTAFVHEGDPVALRAALEQASRRLSVFDGGVVVFDEFGAIVATEPEQPGTLRPEWTAQTSVHQIPQASGALFSEVVADQSLGGMVIIVATSITGRQDEYLGAIAGVFRLDPTADSALYDRIERLPSAEKGNAYLVDGNGGVLYHSDYDLIGGNLAVQPVVQQVLGGGSSQPDVGAFRTRDLVGRDIVASYARVPGTPWTLVVEESWGTLTNPSRAYRQFLLLLLAMGVVVPTLIVTIGVRHITRPIAELIGAAQNVAEGNFDQRINAETGDELEELAEQFNLMAAQLQESYADLERKVADRTKELATLNAIAAEVSHSLDLSEVMNSALDELLEVLEMGTGQAFLLEDETGMLISITHRGLSEEFASYSARLPLDASLAVQAAQEYRPLIRAVADYPEGEGGSQSLRHWLENEELQLVICIPLIAHGTMVGAINLGSRTPRLIAPEEESLLAAIGHQIGVAVENARLYEQAQQLAVMKERNRLARDLHDSVTQALYGVTLYAEAAARQLQSGQVEMASGHLDEIRKTAQESLREMRLLIFELRLPMLKKEGLAAALQARLESVEGRVGLKTKFSAVGNGRLKPEIEEGLYRIAQEALNNALKHAHATRVSVSLRQYDHAVTLEIVDDGRGFDPVEIQERGGFGLRGMEERALRLGGELTVRSSPGKGTQVRMEVGPQ